MMYWDGEWSDHMDGAWGWAGGTMMVLWIVLLLLAIFALAAWLVRSGGGGGANRSGDAADDARSILDRRYAQGEIDHETYRRMRDELSLDRS